MNGKVLKETSTGMNGNFVIDEVKNSNYVLSISHIGYKDYSKSISINNRDIHLGIIELKEDAIQIGSVVVTAQQYRTIQKGDTLQYNASAFKVIEG